MTDAVKTKTRKNVKEMKITCISKSSRGSLLAAEITDWTEFYEKVLLLFSVAAELTLSVDKSYLVQSDSFNEICWQFKSTRGYGRVQIRFVPRCD